MNDLLADILSDGQVYRSRGGLPALSLDEGFLIDPKGRQVTIGPVWEETDEDPEEVWVHLTDEQRASLLALVRLKGDRIQAKAASQAAITELEAYIARMLAGVRTTGQKHLPTDPTPFGHSWYHGAPKGIEDL